MVDEFGCEGWKKREEYSTIALAAISEYAQNPDKTVNNHLITSHECTPEFAHEEFSATMALYEHKTGRTQKNNSRLVYHMRQSFKPDEVSPEIANMIGHELALEYTGGNHAFVVATHTDCRHIHNHIVFCAFNLEADGKFRDAYFNYQDVARISDKLCHEYGLSVIEQKHGWRAPYNEWEKKQGISKSDKEPTKRELLEEIIAQNLEKRPKNLNQLLKYMEDCSCFAKRRGKNISITMPYSKNPIRLNSLSPDFTEEGIKAQIEKMHSNQFARHENSTDGHDEFVIRKSEQGEKIDFLDACAVSVSQTKNATPSTLPRQANEVPPIENISPIFKPSNLQLILDIQNSMKATNSMGYRKWVEKFNMEQMSQTLLFIEKHQLSLDELENMATRKPQTLKQIKSEIEAVEEKMQHTMNLQRQIGSYGKTKEIYKQYRQSKNPSQFKRENEKFISDHEAAKDYFDRHGYGFSAGNNLPTINELRTQYAKLHTSKSKLWEKYHDTRNSDSGISNAWENCKALLQLQPENEIGAKSRNETSL